MSDDSPGQKALPPDMGGVMETRQDVNPAQNAPGEAWNRKSYSTKISTVIHSWPVDNF